jgi:hypothetical protein
LDEHLSWEVHINAICKKVDEGIGVLKRTKPFVAEETLHTIYKALILPYFYCSPLWDNCGTAATCPNRNMNFLHSKLQECTKSELDLFSIPQTQTSLEKGQWIDSQPVSSVSASNPITLLSAGTRRLCGLVKNNVGVRRSKSKEDDADYKLNLIEAYLQISKIKVSPSISVGHELVLKSLRRMQKIYHSCWKSFPEKR